MRGLGYITSGSFLKFIGQGKQRKYVMSRNVY